MVTILESLISCLRAKKLMVSTAESCTGVLVAAMLTELPGSSDVFAGGVSVYSNESKSRLIRVSAELIADKGAVSEEVALAMALGVKKALGTDFGLSITGIAGPGGGTEGKPVGTVWCGMSTPHGDFAVCWQLSGSRSEIRNDAAKLAVEWLSQECTKAGPGSR